MENVTYLPYHVNCPHCQGEFRFAVGVTGSVVIEDQLVVAADPEPAAVKAKRQVKRKAK